MWNTIKQLVGYRKEEVLGTICRPVRGTDGKPAKELEQPKQLVKVTEGYLNKLSSLEERNI